MTEFSVSDHDDRQVPEMYQDFAGTDEAMREADITAPPDTDHSQMTYVEDPSIKWAGRFVRHASREQLENLERDRERIRVEEWTDLPPETPRTPEQEAQLKAVSEAVTGFASRYSTDKVAPKIQTDRDRLRIYPPDRFDQVANTMNPGSDTHGLTSRTGNMVVKEFDDPGQTLVAVQHEVLHRAGIRELAVVEMPDGTPGFYLQRNGIGFSPSHDKPMTFDALDEGLVVTLTRHIQDTAWAESAVLAPFADAVEPGVSATRQLPNGQYNSGLVVSALFEALTERASDIVGSDVKDAFYKMHFTGDVTALRSIHQAFGSKAGPMLARLDFNPGAIANLVDELGIYKSFLEKLKAYKSG